MNETFAYRTGAVQSMQGFECLSMFSPKTLRKALKQLNTDYPGQPVRFGKFDQGSFSYLALQAETPRQPDEWLIVAPVVVAE